MAVLIEAISVIISVFAIEEKFPGGWSEFKAMVPNQTLCSDTEIARVGFMEPADVEAFIAELTTSSLIFLMQGSAIDIAVVDQQRGPTVQCDWLEVGHIDLGGNTSHRVAAARLVNSDISQIVTPDNWQFEGSLSHTFGFSPTESRKAGLNLLRVENGMEVYLNELTGKEVYVGRTS